LLKEKQKKAKEAVKEEKELKKLHDSDSSLSSKDALNEDDGSISSDISAEFGNFDTEELYTK
jgi:hypothetical protein